MTTGFIVALVLIFIVIIGVTILVTNKAYSRKPEQIDPILPSKDTAGSKELDQ
ncbi:MULTISPECIES: hypothetical protein [Bacillales]|uniref:YtzI protein n=1 Tax=Brevibacillus brevis (strain 47 / JCM 6285 / NBRC 100599) TaxID=358681 RepID=C0Z6M7_BREBN|nr:MULTISPECIES: hypothetical protein [Bacillales]NRR06198.1 hypothetical protein [Brevibacillus sp. RS1.1]NRS47117.1 hypothetical protein [Brevibacillus sp. HB2.2]UIO42021.1 hypothetical protein LOY85_25025 [Brevibacillus brevis]WGV59531.1 hypothetical protein QIH01_29380 [Brevibacillus brevis]WJQ81051.1 hypothetical protein QN310_27000 [Brevibacillus brevis]